MVKAVLFDMDGLLMNSEAIGLTGMQCCGRKQGYELPLDMIRQTLGATSAFSCDLYHRHFPDLDTRQLFVDFREYMHTRAQKGEIPLMPGARELLDWCRARGIRRAVASSSMGETVELYLSSQRVLDQFDAVVAAGGSGLPSKPAPDIFLEAARRLGVEPADCLVLEDSPNGVRAGRAAGMRVFMIPDQIPFTEELRPFCDAVLPSLWAVPGQVEP